MIVIKHKASTLLVIKEMKLLFGVNVMCLQKWGEKKMRLTAKKMFLLYRHHKHLTTNTCIYATARHLKGTCHMTTHAGDVENNGE